MAAHSAHSIPAAVGDKAMHLLNGLAGDFQIGLVAQMARQLDETVLETALAHVLAAHPVAASRFVTKPGGASWEPVVQQDGGRVKIVPAAGEESRLLAWFEQPVDCAAGSAVEWAIFRGEADCLCVKLSHLVADAGGLKELAYLVASAYAAAATGRPLPTVPVQARGLSQIAARFSFRQKAGILGRMVRDLALHHPFATPATPPGRITPEGRRVYVKVVAPTVLVRAMQKWGKERDATMNDVVMAAFLRALAYVAPHGRNRDLRLVVTADLRRYLAEEQRTGSVANLSGWVLTRFGPSLGPDLGHTCRMVSRQMSARKRDYLGLGLVTAAAGFSALPPAMARSLAGPVIHKAARFRNDINHFSVSGGCPYIL